MSLMTPEAALQLLTSNGYTFKSSCNCGGTYWEKFANHNGTLIKVAPRKNFVKVHQLPIRGTIDQLENLIAQINEN